MEEPKYISVNEAAKRAQYSPRHFHRFLDRGEIASVRENASSIKVEMASLDAWLEQRGTRPVDPLKLVKQELEQVQEKFAAQEQVNGKLTLENAELRNLITKWAARVEALEAKFRVQAGQQIHGSGADSPDGTIMLVDFAKNHAVTMGKLRTLVEHDPTLATVIERPEAVSKKHKWMIGLNQMACMLAAIQAKGIAYAPCGDCPHAATEHPPLAQ